MAAKKKNRWQKALDESNARQGELSPYYKSRLDEQKRKENGAMEKARANQKKKVVKKKTATKKKKR